MHFQSSIWTQATERNITVPDPRTCGWEERESVMMITADTKTNMDRQATIFETIMKRCNCKKSQCKGNCSCRKRQQMCTSLCGCINCLNTPDNQKEGTVDDFDTDYESDTDIDDPPNEDTQEIKDIDYMYPDKMIQ